MTSVTVILNSIESGNARTQDLLPLVYDELRQLAAGQMRNERVGQTLQATALVHEAFLRLVGDQNATWENRRHFFGAAALAMQRILVEQARRKSRLKHGGELQEVAFSEVEIIADVEQSADELLALDEALIQFQIEEPEKAELVRLRYFAGLTEEEAALALNISRATASRWWTYSKAWLFAKMRDD
jgi:RNA polymerase sigma factor (TIGR02999 family)